MKLTLHRHKWILMLSFALLLLNAACASAGPVGPVVRDWTCAAAQTELALCASGLEPRAENCRYAEIVNQACGAQLAAPESSLLAVAGERGTGYRSPANRSCWRSEVSGPEHRASGDLSIDPWLVAGIPLGTMGELPCGRPEVEAAHKSRYGADCIGPNSPRGGWCGASNENLRNRGKVAIEWACEHQPELIRSLGLAGGWDCIASGRELTDLGAFDGGWNLILSIERAMASAPPAESGCKAPQTCMEPPPPCREPEPCPVCPACKVCPPPCVPVPPQVLAAVCTRGPEAIPARRAYARSQILKACDFLRRAAAACPAP